MFDGSVLHGVLPGRGPAAAPGARRVTLMVAFWRDLKLRPGDKPGAARPFPGIDIAMGHAHDEKPWPALFAPLDSIAGGDCETEQEGHGLASIKHAEVLPVHTIWQDVDEAANVAAGCSCTHGQVQGLPPYELCYQGF